MRIRLVTNKKKWLYHENAYGQKYKFYKGQIVEHRANKDLEKPILYRIDYQTKDTPQFLGCTIVDELGNREGSSLILHINNLIPYENKTKDSESENMVYL